MRYRQEGKFRWKWHTLFYSLPLNRLQSCAQAHMQGRLYKEDYAFYPWAQQKCYLLLGRKGIMNYLGTTKKTPENNQSVLYSQQGPSNLAWHLLWVSQTTIGSIYLKPSLLLSLSHFTAPLCSHLWTSCFLLCRVGLWARNFLSFLYCMLSPHVFLWLWLLLFWPRVPHPVKGQFSLAMF